MYIKSFTKQLKILHVTPHYEPAFEMGGVVRSVSQLCRGLAFLGVDVTVFTTNNNRIGNILNVPVNQEVHVEGVKVWYFPTRFLNRSFFYSPALGKACYERIREYDILHLTSFWCFAGIPAGKAARTYNIPYIMSTHGTLIPYSLKQGWLKKRIFMALFERKNLDGATAIHYTNELERESTHYANRLKNPSFIAANPVPLNEIINLPEKDQAKELLSLPQDALTISYVGRLHKRKALDCLISSFAKILPQLNNNCYLLIAGPDDGDEARLKKLVIKNKMLEKVKFLGFVDANKRGIVLRASDLFWLATYPGENFGYSAVEAMAAGVPVILSRHVGIYPEVLRDGAGIVISHDSDDICKEVLALFRGKEKLIRMSENAKHSVFKYETNKIAPLMLKAYKDVLIANKSSELLWK